MEPAADEGAPWPAPLPEALLDPLVNAAPNSSMYVGIVLHNEIGPIMSWCSVLQIRRQAPMLVTLGRYDIRFAGSIVSLEVTS